MSKIEKLNRIESDYTVSEKSLPKFDFEFKLNWFQEKLKEFFDYLSSLFPKVKENDSGLDFEAMVRYFIIGLISIGLILIAVALYNKFSKTKIKKRAPSSKSPINFSNLIQKLLYLWSNFLFRKKLKPGMTPNEYFQNNDFSKNLTKAMFDPRVKVQEKDLENIEKKFNE